MKTLKPRLDRLDGDIRRLKIEYDKFLNGAVPTPPDELRAELLSELRALRGHNATSYADGFLLGSLEARLNSLSELYNRRVREAEMGLGPPSSGAPKARQYDPYSGVVFRDEVTSDAAHALYEELYGSPDRRARTDFSSFLHFLEQKASTIRDLTGCHEVQFRIDSRDGRLALKAKPVLS
jgi:hypothetical protein